MPCRAARRSCGATRARSRCQTSEGAILALLEVDEVYPHDILREMRAVLGGRDSAHPLVIEAKRWPSHYLAGRPRVLDLPRHRLHGPLCLTPAQVRERLIAMGNPTVVAFQTRNPMHRIHEELTKRAQQAVGGTLLIHPTVGVTRPQDVGYALRVEAYEALVRAYYDPSRTGCSRSCRWRCASPVPARPSGTPSSVATTAPRTLSSAVTTPAPGRTSLGIPFYGPYDAQAMAEHYSHEIGVQTILARELAYLTDEDRYVELDEVPRGARRVQHLRHAGARGVPGQGQEAARVVHPPRSGGAPAAGVRAGRRCGARRLTAAPG